MAGITSDLAKKSGDPLRGVTGRSLDNFRRDNIAGPHGKYFLSQRERKPRSASDQFLSPPPPVIKSTFSLPTPAHPQTPTCTKIQI